MYIAYLCYPYAYDDDDVEPTIKFEEPASYLYDKVVPISFSVIHRWTQKDEELYK